MDIAYLELFNYLRDVIYDPKNAALDITKLPDEMQDFGSSLKYFAEDVFEANAIALALSAGVLDYELPSHGNEIAAPLKSLQSSLRHLTWQAQRVAQGDYEQRVMFIREFSNAFNSMIEQLADKERRLEKQSIDVLKKSLALDQGNLLLTSIIHHIPQQIFVIDGETLDILLMNDIASYELKQDKNYLKKIVEAFLEGGLSEDKDEIEIRENYNGECYMIARKFLIDWNDSPAEIYIVNDLAATRRRNDNELSPENRDYLTNLYNREYGMLMLDRWQHEEKSFVVIMVNLEGIRFVNEVYGEKEGDRYMINVSGYLQSISEDAVVCRLGGDEFMVLVSDINFGQAQEKILEISEKLQNDEYQMDKGYQYNLSFGIAEVSERNMLSTSEILRIADERMYESKKQNAEKLK